MLWSVIRLIFKSNSVTPDFFYVFNLILSFSTCSQSFKKICAWELLGANVLNCYTCEEGNFCKFSTFLMDILEKPIALFYDNVPKTQTNFVFALSHKWCIPVGVLTTFRCVLADISRHWK